MDKLWNFAFKYLFSNKTNLFYDHITELTDSALEKTLPSTEEIKEHRPNPNGWSTGMEDSVMKGSTMLESSLVKMKISPSDETLEQIKKIYEGLKLCATISKDKGFVARSVSPIDNTSHYINSSRDQYTHLIFSFTKYYFSSFSSEKEKAEIAEIFTNIALRLEKTVTPENDYEFPREDGINGICQKMWGELGIHEYLRLPMFYLAAYVTTKNNHFYDLYLKYRDEALLKSEDIQFEAYGIAYPILQMQLSFKYLYEYDSDEQIRNRLSALMNKANEHFKEYAKDKFKDLLTCKETINFKYKRWTDVPGYNMGVFGGLPYINHNQDIYEENKAYYLLRNIGDAVSICALSGVYSNELLELVVKSAEFIDTNDHFSNAPLYLLGGYYSMLKLK